MPKMSKQGKPKKSELPSTIARSSKKAQRTFAKAHDSALEEYGDEERANKVGFAALKRRFEKVGKRWERKEKGRSGPSDAKAAAGYPASEDVGSAGGVDANASVAHLRELARRLKIPGRSTMNKADLVEALQKANAKETAQAREG